MTDNILHEITASAIQRYLLLKGWEQDYNFKNKKLMVFSHSQLNQKIAIPANERFEDFYIVLSKVLRTLSLFENRDIIFIIKEIITVYFDRFEFRIITDRARNGKLPLDYASECIRGLKDLVLYATCAEMDKKPVCPRANKQALEKLGDFNFAQTEKGSFIINIDVRVLDENSEQLTLDSCLPPSPFQHKIVKRINTAIQQVDDIVEKKEQLSRAAETAYETGITANMCDALLCLKPAIGSIQIDTTIRYAAALTKNLEENNHVVITPQHFYTMDELSKIYRDKILYEDVILRGMVIMLSKHDKEDIVEKTIKLMTVFNEQYRVIMMDLSDDDYRRACDAHRDEKEVEVAGELDMSKRTYVLSKIEYFKTI